MMIVNKASYPKALLLWWHVRRHVRCLDNSSGNPGAFCKKRHGHLSRWHRTGNRTLKWQTRSMPGGSMTEKPITSKASDAND